MSRLSAALFVLVSDAALAADVGLPFRLDILLGRCPVPQYPARGAA
jgi:hypothetical protein